MSVAYSLGTIFQIGLLKRLKGYQAMGYSERMINHE